MEEEIKLPDISKIEAKPKVINLDVDQMKKEIMKVADEKQSAVLVNQQPDE